MTPYQRRLSPYTERMVADLKIRNCSQNTIDSYSYHVDRFCRHFNQPAEALDLEHIRDYQIYLVNEKHASWSSFNQAVCALGPRSCQANRMCESSQTPNRTTGLLRSRNEAQRSDSS